MLMAICKVTGFDIGEDGGLLMIAGDSVVLHAMPASR